MRGFLRLVQDYILIPLTGLLHVFGGNPRFQNISTRLQVHTGHSSTFLSLRVYLWCGDYFSLP